MKRTFTGLALAAAVLLMQHNAVAAPKATIVHFNFTTTMTGADDSFGEASAKGSIYGTFTRRGNVSNQRLSIHLANLDVHTPYELVAFLGDDTKSTSVAEFTTDRKGKFKVLYVKNGRRSTPRGSHALPSVLDPLCNVREMSVLNTNGETVLHATLTRPDKGPYLVSGNLNNMGFLPSAAGAFRIMANTRSTQFRLTASGLTRNAEYFLTINGNVVQTNTATRAGSLKLTALPAGSPNVLDIHNVALTDNTGTNVVLISGGFGIPCTAAAQMATTLDSAAHFAVLAGAEVTSTGNTEVTGDLGVWAGTGVTGFAGVVPGGPGTVSGTIHAGDSVAQIAQGDLTTAYNDAAGRTLAPVDVANADLGGRTLTPGLYKSSGTLFVTGNLTLDAQGDLNAVFIFQVASSLGTASGSQVILTGGAKAANVFWQVGSSATLATTTAFKGTIMADQSISLANGATLEGRALARIGSVTMDENIITIPAP